MAVLKRIAIVTGGTGGHIFPAMALAHQVADELPHAEVLFIGGHLENNRYFDRTSFPYRSVSCGTVLKRSPQAILKGCYHIVKGIWESRRILRKFRPDVVVGFGSYYSFPPLMAARWLGIPMILHEANSIPGKVIRLLAPAAKATGVHFPMTLKLLKGKAVEVGMPLRKEFTAKVSQEIARKHFGLRLDEPVVLVFGGSQGARALNCVVQEALSRLHASVPLQVIHIVGDAAAVATFQQHYLRLGISCYVAAFEKRMDLAWKAADCAVCRAGASTIAELMESVVPAILVPYPFAADNHQEHNARFVADDVGGGVMLLESSLTATTLGALLEDCFANGGEKLKQWRQAIEEYNKKARTHSLLSLMMEGSKRC